MNIISGAGTYEHSYNRFWGNEGYASPPPCRCQVAFKRRQIPVSYSTFCGPIFLQALFLFKINESCYYNIQLMCDLLPTFR
jgi:hypothetical protein